MKVSLIILLISLTNLAFAQTSNNDIEFIIEGLRDTAYIHDEYEGLILHIIENRIGISKYKNEPVYKNSEVNKPAELIDAYKPLDKIVLNNTKKLINLLPKGIYNFWLKHVLISNQGKLIFYELEFYGLTEYYKYLKRVNNSTKLQGVIETAIGNEIREIKLSNFLKYKTKWIPARNKGKAVHTYFDKPIKITIEVI